ncbi:uncharacterized protein C2orf50 homolog [Dromiciops gliroides]|uniref:uncharacterized protein C2orf50 homolog n=1 Tax=Dromiciops gliroides TaxID=33562 RepID=UPI001CC45183|nr:uncharacterized protein C2orf50 homolog [Dromiciops gliroides]
MESPSPAFQRTTSAGQRHQSPRPLDSALASSPSFRRIPAGISALKTEGAQAREAEQAALQANQVHQDNLWRELLEAELRSNKRWIENWSFLKDYDPLGNKKKHPKLPEHISLFSGTVPSTANQVIGSKVNTELGKKIASMDFFFAEGNRKKKLKDGFQSTENSKEILHVLPQSVHQA